MERERKRGHWGRESDFFSLDINVIRTVFATLSKEEKRLIRSYFYGRGQNQAGSDQELERVLRKMRILGNNIQDKRDCQIYDGDLVATESKNLKWHLSNRKAEVKPATVSGEDKLQYTSRMGFGINRPPEVLDEYRIERVKYEARRRVSEWTEAELMSYFVAVNKSEVKLLGSGDYPDTIKVSDIWRKKVFELLSVSSGFAIQDVRQWIVVNPDRSVGVSQAVKGYRRDAGFSERDEFDSEWWGEVDRKNFLGEMSLDSWSPPLFVLPTDREFVSLKTIYSFVSDRVKLPVKVASTLTKNFWLLRGKDTTNFPGLPSDDAYLDFRNLWYRQSGVDTEAVRGIGRLFSTDGIPWFDPSGDRREIGLKACRALNITVYESDEKNTQRLVKLT